MEGFYVEDYDRKKFAFMIGKNITEFRRKSDELSFMKNHRNIYFWYEEADEECAVLVKVDKKGIIKELVNVDLIGC